MKNPKSIFYLLAAVVLAALGCGGPRYLKSLQDDDFYLTLLSQASLDEEEGNLGGAIASYRQAVKLNPHSALLNLQLAHAYYRAGDNALALRYGRRAVALAPEDADCRLVLGNAYIQAKDFSAAIVQYRQAYRLRPGDNILSTLAGLYEAKGLADSAAAMFERRLQSQDSPAIRFQLASLLARSARWAEALGQYRLLFQAGSTAPELLSALGSLHQIQRDPDSALYYFTRAEALQPANLQIKYYIFNLLLEKGDYSAAILQAQQMLELDPGNVKIRLPLARLYLRLSDTARAQAQFAAILEQDSTQVEALYHLARMKIDLKDFLDAKVYLKKTLSLIPRLPEAWYLLGLCHTAADQPDSAAWAFRRSRFYGNRYSTNYQLAQAYYVLERYRQALPYFRKLYPHHQRSVVFLFQYGAVLERTGNYEEAVPIFRKLLKLDPNHASALNYLGYMFAERGQNLAEAESLIARALALEPDNPFYIDSRGWVYYMSGRYQEACRDLEQAVSLMPNDATLREHLGDVYQALGQIPRAREQWQRALEIEPDRASAQKKLEAVPEQ